MPVLDNPRHERFAQEIAKGESSRDAYKAAGYETNNVAAADASASRLLSEAKVRARIEELQTRAAAKAEVTVQRILEELEEARQLAKQIEQPSAMVSASMGRAKVAGIVVDRKEVGKPGEFSNVPDDELVEAIRDGLKEFPDLLQELQANGRGGKTKH